MFTMYRSFLKNFVHDGSALFLCFFSFTLPFHIQDDDPTNIIATHDRIILRLKKHHQNLKCIW